MEEVVGRLLKEKNKKVAVYEDVTGGMLAERLQQASPSHFVEGIIGPGPAPMRRLLAFSRRGAKLDELAQEPSSLTGELAWCVRAQAESDLGLALHALPDPQDKTINMARGQTYVAVTDGKACKNMTYGVAGRSHPDRMRMSLSALELLRSALLEGIA